MWLPWAFHWVRTHWRFRKVPTKKQWSPPNWVISDPEIIEWKFILIYDNLPRCPLWWQCLTGYWINGGISHHICTRMTSYDVETERIQVSMCLELASTLGPLGIVILKSKWIPTQGCEPAGNVAGNEIVSNNLCISVRTLPWCLLHTLVADRDVLPKLLMFSTESRMVFGSQLDVESVSLYGNILIVGRYAAKSVKFLSANWMPNIFQSWNGQESWMLTIIVPHRMRRKHRSTAPISPGNSLSLKRSECHSVSAGSISHVKSCHIIYFHGGFPKFFKFTHY